MKKAIAFVCAVVFAVEGLAVSDGIVFATSKDYEAVLAANKRTSFAIVKDGWTKEILDYYRLPETADAKQLAKLTAMANEIAKGAKDDYAKIRAVHDWAAKNIYYDYGSSVGHSPFGDNPYATLRQKYGVCADYAWLTRTGAGLSRT